MLNECICRLISKTLLGSFFFFSESPGQNFVTLDYRLHYYPGITYAVIGSAIIFVLIVALLALVLHHQRKQSVLLSRGVCHRGACQQSLLLSRLVIIDRGHIHSPQSSYPSQPLRVVRNIQLFPCSQHSTTGAIGLLPSYSQAVLDVEYVYFCNFILDILEDLY